MRFPYNLYSEWNIETYEDIKRSRRFCYLLEVVSFVSLFSLYAVLDFLDISTLLKVLTYIAFFVWSLVLAISTLGIIYKPICIPTYKEVVDMKSKHAIFNLYVGGRLKLWRDSLITISGYSVKIMTVASLLLLILFLSLINA